MKTRLILALSCLTLAGCAGFPVMLTGSYEKDFEDGSRVRAGVAIPLGKSGKQPVPVSFK